MGMYTGLRGTIVLKREYLDKFSNELESEDGFCWENILPSDNKFYNYNRNLFIPNGLVCWMPYDWDNFEEGKLDGNSFTFCCSLKNHCGTIEVFLEHCLPLIADKWKLEELYEEDEVPTQHVNWY